MNNDIHLLYKPTLFYLYLTEREEIFEILSKFLNLKVADEKSVNFVK